MPSHNLDSDFMPMVRCPHCKGVNHPPISGWGGELSTRTKACKHCGLEYVLVVYATGDKKLNLTSSRINSIKSRIKYLRTRMRELLHKVDNKNAEMAEEYIRVESSTRGRQN